MTKVKIFEIDGEKYVATEELNEDRFVLVEKPHRGKSKAYVTHWDEMALSVDAGVYGSYFDGNLESKEDLLEYAAHDFSGLDKIDSIEEAAKYCQNGPSYQHNANSAMTAVKDLCFKKACE